MNNNNWKTGQRLNSAAEALRALLDGQIVTEKFKEKVANLHLTQRGWITPVDDPNNPYFVDTEVAEYLIYTPPKRKVKIERWINVLLGIGGPFTLMYDTKEEALKAEYPGYIPVYKHILARAVPFACEVEVGDE